MTKVKLQVFYTPEQKTQIIAPTAIEIEVDARFVKPHEILEEAAKLAHQNSAGEWFGKDGERVEVLEPPELAGVWNVHVDYEPMFSAVKEPSVA